MKNIKLDGWKTNLSILIAIGLALYGKYSGELETQDMGYFLGAAAALYAGGKRVQRKGSVYSKQNESYTTMTFSLVGVVMATMGYYLGWHDYMTMGVEVVASTGYVGLEHKLQKTERGRIEQYSEQELQDAIVELSINEHDGVYSDDSQYDGEH